MSVQLHWTSILLVETMHENIGKMIFVRVPQMRCENSVSFSHLPPLPNSGGMEYWVTSKWNYYHRWCRCCCRKHQNVSDRNFSVFCFARQSSIRNTFLANKRASSMLQKVGLGIHIKINAFVHVTQRNNSLVTKFYTRGCAYVKIKVLI